MTPEMEALLMSLVQQVEECKMAEAPEPEKALSDLMAELGLEYPKE